MIEFAVRSTRIYTPDGPREGAVLVEKNVERNVEKNVERNVERNVEKSVEKTQEPRLEIVSATSYHYDTEYIKIEVLGGINMEQVDKLRTTLRITRNPKRNGLDVVRQNLDLYHSTQVGGLLKKLHETLEIPTAELRLVVADLVEELEVFRQEMQLLGATKSMPVRLLTSERERLAMQYLSDKKLMENTAEDLSKVGVIGEEINALVMYLCFSSRKLPQPLHIISLGSSGSGKTHLQECISELIPEQEIINITSLSDNALYYYPKGALKGILFLVEDMDGMTEEAMYAMRELKSKGFLLRYVPMKDQRGKLETVSVSVEGPICFAGCTTKEKVYEDNANRCLLLRLLGGIASCGPGAAKAHRVIRTGDPSLATGRHEGGSANQHAK